MKCKVKANYLEVNGQLGKSLLVLLFLLSKLVAIPRKKLQSPWRHDDKQICTHQKNQFKLDIACENSRFSSLFAAEDVSKTSVSPRSSPLGRRAWRNGCFRRLLSRGITSATQRQKFLTDDVKLFTNDRQKTEGNTKGHEGQM